MNWAQQNMRNPSEKWAAYRIPRSTLFCKSSEVCSHSFEIAFHTQSCHTFETDPVQKVTMPNLRLCVGNAGQRFYHYDKGLSGASRYGHVGTVGILLARPL